MKCFVLNINIISSPHDVMQIARNKLCTKENVCFFPKYPRYLTDSLKTLYIMLSLGGNLLRKFSKTPRWII